MKRLKALGIIAVALAAILGLWTQLGLPTIAWSTDIKHLKDENIKQGVVLYTGQLRQFLYHSPQTMDGIVLEQWQEIVKEKRRNLKIYEDLWIEREKAKIK